MEFLDLLGSL
jgi:hypothetical protein